jgi:hypothetical protein
LLSGAQAGVVQGEDYTFAFSGRLDDGILKVELQLQYDGSDNDDDMVAEQVSATIITYFTPILRYHR